MVTSLVLPLILMANLQLVLPSEGPVIGILSQEFSPTEKGSFIVASYVKALEASGARVVPLLIRKPASYYRDMVNSINGLVLPGGSVSFTAKAGHAEYASILFDMILKMNQNGDHFPVLGVCQGFQLLVYLSNNKSSNSLFHCSAFGLNLPLKFTPGYRNSSLYGGASPTIIHILANKNVTPNFHEYCVSQGILRRLPWRVLSLNNDISGKEFVSSIEWGPIAGVQFHPEKCAYEWGQNNPSDEDALLAARHFYDWFVKEARKNQHTFSNRSLETEHLIYNYSPLYTGKLGGYNEQTYVFNEISDNRI